MKNALKKPKSTKTFQEYHLYRVVQFRPEDRIREMIDEMAAHVRTSDNKSGNRTSIICLAIELLMDQFELQTGDCGGCNGV